MEKVILLDARYPKQVRAVALNENKDIEAFEWETNEPQIKNNIYLVNCGRIEQGLQAVFFTLDDGKSGFLPFNEIHPGFFNNAQAIGEGAALSELKLSGRGSSKEDDANNEAHLSQPVNPETETPEEEEYKAKVDYESLSDELEESKLPYQSAHKKFKIQDVISPNQPLVVQAVKEAKGNKAATFTTFLSLAGRYCVLMPNTPKQNGVSKRIIDSSERKRLRDIVNSITSDENFSIIVRTSGLGKSFEEIYKDCEYLVNSWNKIYSRFTASKPPKLLYIEEAIVPRVLRNMLDEEVVSIVVDGSSQYRQASSMLSQLFPGHKAKLVQHKSKVPIFSAYEIEEKIMQLYQPIVSLPSGAYIVINPTEALTSIDINSGRSTYESSIEETALKTNLEAAKHIAHHLRLREISGIIVIDFIDMQEAKHRRMVENALKEALVNDRAKLQVGSINSLGLLELSRQRLRPSFLESHASICKYCSGKGLVRSVQATSALIFRTIDRELAEDSAVHALNVRAHKDVIFHILNRKREEIKSVEENFTLEINFYPDEAASAESFSLEKIKYQNAELQVANHDTTPKSRPKHKENAAKNSALPTKRPAKKPSKQQA